MAELSNPCTLSHTNMKTQNREREREREREQRSYVMDESC